jgi:hypothetical protein
MTLLPPGVKVHLAFGYIDLREISRVMTDYFHARDPLEGVSRGCVMALSRFSTCGPKTSLHSDIFRGPSISRLANWSIAWVSSRRTARSSPIAAAFSRSRRSRRSARAAISSAGSKMVIPNGGLPVCRSKPWSDARRVRRSSTNIYISA